MFRFVKTCLKRCSIICFVFLLFLGSVSLCAEAETANALDPDLDTVLTSVSSYILEKDPAPEFDSVWMVLGMARSNLDIPQSYFDQYYSNVVAYCEACDWQLSKTKFTEYSKAILGLTAIGVDAQDVMGHNLFSYLSDFSNVQKQGISGPIWTLIALNANPSYSIPTDPDASEQTTEEVLIQYLLDRECDDGGWTLAGNEGYCDITGMVLQAFAPYYGERDDVTAAVDRGLTWLSENQISDGSFPSNGTSSSESCSQVIVALSTLGIDCGQDSRFIKNGCWPLSALLDFYLPEGGFMHVTAGSDDGGGGAGGIIDGKGTEQGFYAVVSYTRLLNGENALYDMSDVTLSPGTEPTISSTIGSTASTGTGIAVSSGTKTSGAISVTGVQLNHNTLTMKTGKTKKLKATVSPSNASNPALKWTSSDESVAKVTQKGKVTAIKAGTTTIKVKAKDGSGKKATCKVTVKKASSTGTSTSTSGNNKTSAKTGTASSKTSGTSGGTTGGTSDSKTTSLTGTQATPSMAADTGETSQAAAYAAEKNAELAGEQSGSEDAQAETGWSFTGKEYVADADGSDYEDGYNGIAYADTGDTADENIEDGSYGEAATTTEGTIPALPTAVGGISEAVLICGMFFRFRKNNFVGSLINIAAKFLRRG